MAQVKGDNGIVYEQWGTKPVEQALDEKWFLWLSADADLKNYIVSPTDGGPVTLDEATETVRQFAVEMVRPGEEYEGDNAGIVSDVLQICLDYTDWRHLAQRLCNNFGIEVKA